MDSLELKYAWRFKVLDAATSILHALIPWGFTFCIVLVLSKTLGKFAGTTSLADISFHFFADFKVTEIIAYTFGVTGMAYGWNQRRLRQKNIERLAERPRQLEQSIDPGRSSSHLTTKGTTRAEDQ